MLLALTAAFDTADHSILISGLEHCIGVLLWSGSGHIYLTEVFLSALVTPHPLHCGIPQGSILGPILFSLCLLSLGSIFRKHDILLHCYPQTTVKQKVLIF